MMLLDKGTGLQTHETVSIPIVIILRLLRIVHMKPALFENVHSEKTGNPTKATLLQRKENVWHVSNPSSSRNLLVLYVHRLLWLSFEGIEENQAKTPK
jgi:hypothetical protein